jgi:hypothetical protein
LFIQKSIKDEKAEKSGTAEKERKYGEKAEEVATLSKTLLINKLQQIIFFETITI